VEQLHRFLGFCEEQMIAVTRKFFVLLSFLALSFGLSACAEEEQNRVLSYEKGTYLGKKDQKLTEAQLRQLVLRSNGQRTY
jgi:hypothetical protein